MTAVWFRPDNMRAEYDQAPPYKALHQAAADRGLVFKVERSNITRGWTYNSNIFRVESTGKFYEDAPHIERKRYVPFGAGSGLDPIQSLIHGVRLARLDDPLILVLILECEVWLLDKAIHEAAERERQAEARAASLRKLDATLDGLTDLLASVNHASPAPAGQTVKPQPDEDDDL